MKPTASVNELVPADVLNNLKDDEREWLENTFSRFGGHYPSLEQIWGLMDEPWSELRCDPAVMDERIGRFYAHPVWLLNGLFIEQHEQSLLNRKQFATWVERQKPTRLADYGGGFGGLARMIGAMCPDTQVEVIEPHPHPAAIALAEKTSNVRYVPDLSGEYDVLIATDVFEHVPDPLGLAAKTAESLRQGGHYLIANCFEPIILCHLPQTFHFRWTWDLALARMGLVPEENVVYGRSFMRTGELLLAAARITEERSKGLYPLTRNLPGRVARLISRMLIR